MTRVPLRRIHCSPVVLACLRPPLLSHPYLRRETMIHSCSEPLAPPSSAANEGVQCGVFAPHRRTVSKGASQ